MEEMGKEEHGTCGLGEIVSELKKMCCLGPFDKSLARVSSNLSLLWRNFNNLCHSEITPVIYLLVNFSFMVVVLCG